MSGALVKPETMRSERGGGTAGALVVVVRSSWDTPALPHATTNGKVAQTSHESDGMNSKRAAKAVPASRRDFRQTASGEFPRTRRAPWHYHLCRACSNGSPFIR